MPILVTMQEPQSSVCQMLKCNSSVLCYSRHENFVWIFLPRFISGICKNLRETNMGCRELTVGVYWECSDIIRMNLVIIIWIMVCTSGIPSPAEKVPWEFSPKMPVNGLECRRKHIAPFSFWRPMRTPNPRRFGPHLGLRWHSANFFFMSLLPAIVGLGWKGRTRWYMGGAIFSPLCKLFFSLLTRNIFFPLRQRDTQFPPPSYNHFSASFVNKLYFYSLLNKLFFITCWTSFFQPPPSHVSSGRPLSTCIVNWHCLLKVHLPSL